jgi:hypothetical protein
MSQPEPLKVEIVEVTGSEQEKTVVRYTRCWHCLKPFHDALIVGMQIRPGVVAVHTPCFEAAQKVAGKMLMRAAA